MDISDFYSTFFEEAEELLGDMEAHLLALDVDNPDMEQLNAIFRAAHSIKGGAGTFGFEALQRTTHLLENLLDYTRRGELTLRRDIVDTFLEAKDMLHDQLDAYRQGVEPDAEAMARICEVLRKLALEEIGEPASEVAPAATPPPASGGAGQSLSVALLGVSESDRKLLIEELGQLGDVLETRGEDDRYEVLMQSTASADDIEAVMCFIVEPEQLDIRGISPEQLPVPVKAPEPPPKAETKSAARPAVDSRDSGANSSIRVPVAKVDHIINLVGELIITQSMLNQVVEDSEFTGDGGFASGLSLLQRTARDLQEAVMSVRMVPMDYVFSRFPRLVRDLAGKLGKDVELITEGKSTELDKSLTERIIDPLTHLVRNSLDHGLETPELRAAAGKPGTGRLTLSAQHQGGNILIEVSDDGAGLDRERILAKARSNGLPVSDNMSDEEVWQLIFAPGFSTAEAVSDVSGRGVGMDVVKRNIQAMGGHVDVLSEAGQGTRTRIVLPLTLAILDGMSVRVGEETFILPVSAVIESLQPRADDLYTMAGGDVLLKVREDYLPLVALHHAMEVSGAVTDPTSAIVVIVQGEGRRYALLVDELVGQQQVVVKNLETNYRKVPGVSAATILGDGSVALILDIPDLHRLSQSKKASDAVARNSTVFSSKEVSAS
ncbi:CheA signal transduction histidine kinase [Alcanivorax balearicus MACL04]|uniref:Chemotaxis protein CheA n=1 Tax=Alloalcanivorax balearicus MACL04 TaxID=1177182 RepID=A0ABT2R3A7_9GAMM|nr:chemotaxis protein CheA [Alloalcanivorax balearicus]MCU5784262.1 CheA signal transduction histidine kinase [Alloalcanivorax balearicus MACL04]